MHGNRNLQTEELLQALYANDDASVNWLTGSFGRKLESRDLAAMLKDYGIHAAPWDRPASDHRKGLPARDFASAWERYLINPEEGYGSGGAG